MNAHRLILIRFLTALVAGLAGIFLAQGTGIYYSSPSFHIHIPGSVLIFLFIWFTFPYVYRKHN